MFTRGYSSVQLIAVLWGFSALSLALNLYLIFKKRRPGGVRHPSQELQEFMADLTSGGGMLFIKRIDTQDVLLRSPKRHQ